MTAPVRVPVRLGDLLTDSSRPGGRWSLVGSAGLWCADCLVPGCGWSTTTTSSDTAAAAATVHDLSHPTPTSPEGSAA